MTQVIIALTDWKLKASVSLTVQKEKNWIFIEIIIKGQNVSKNSEDFKAATNRTGVMLLY